MDKLVGKRPPPPTYSTPLFDLSTNNSVLRILFIQRWCRPIYERGTQTVVDLGIDLNSVRGHLIVLALANLQRYRANSEK